MNPLSKEEQRTGQQNRALHLYFRLIADALNFSGYDLVKTVKAFKDGIDIPWNERMVKEILWREIQKSMFGKESTKDLTKLKEIDQCWEVMNRFLGERLKIESVPFPSIGEIMDKQNQ